MKVFRSYDENRRKVEITINPEDGRGSYSMSTNYDATGWAGVEFADTVASVVAAALDVELINVEPPEEW